MWAVQHIPKHPGTSRVCATCAATARLLLLVLEGAHSDRYHAYPTKYLKTKKHFIFISSQSESFSDLFLCSSVSSWWLLLSLFFSCLSAVLQLCCPEQHSSECSAPRSHAENRWKIPAACAHLSPILPCGQGKAVAFSLCEGLASEQSYKTWLPVSALYNSAYILHQSLCGIFPMRKDRYVGKSLKSWTLPLG